jgi:hypothetical protein
MGIIALGFAFLGVWGLSICLVLPGVVVGMWVFTKGKNKLSLLQVMFYALGAMMLLPTSLYVGLKCAGPLHVYPRMQSVVGFLIVTLPIVFYISWMNRYLERTPSKNDAQFSLLQKISFILGAFLLWAIAFNRVFYSSLAPSHSFLVIQLIKLVLSLVPSLLYVWFLDHYFRRTAKP